ncbi:uncharacterized protein LOC130933927 [Arachis stenosperma]|uniref:uncharacterized protein LOC130933927 n=1 Tax=Arachis stenosperma TaxID=217475 RepID=UPI0025AD8D55|nr:uncharacterized protein LOC130933927 [Arachis stenosperma]
MDWIRSVYSRCLSEYDPKIVDIDLIHKVIESDRIRKVIRSDCGFHVEYLKTLEIKIPFVEALEQIPSYAKFMKDILSHKKHWRETQIVLLTEECSAIIQNNLPEKLKDLGSFMIPCILGDTCTRTALCGLGTSINLIPAALIKKLCLTDEVKPTRICLQLADGSIKIPSGLIEDMIVRVGPFASPTDFVHPDIPEDCMSIDLIDFLVENVNMAKSSKDRLDDILNNTQHDSGEPLKTSEEKEKPPKLELKPLPSSIKYAFLGEGDTYPVQ